MQNVHFHLGYIGKKYVAKDWNLNWDTSIFQFEYHRLYYLTEGNGTIQLNNGISFTIEPHVLYFVPAYSIKKTHAENRMHQYFIHFQMESSLLNTQLELSPYQAVPVSLERRTFISSLCESIVSNAQLDTFRAALELSGALMQLLSITLQNIDLSGVNFIAFKEVLTYIENNLTNPITLRELANLMGYNCNYFSNKFKQTLGLPPQSFILKKRLSRALQMLLNSDYTVSQITMLCGFHSDSYFIKQFKNEFSLSPIQYRKRQSQITHLEL